MRIHQRGVNQNEVKFLNRNDNKNDKMNINANKTKTIHMNIKKRDKKIPHFTDKWYLSSGFLLTWKLKRCKALRANDWLSVGSEECHLNPNKNRMATWRSVETSLINKPIMYGACTHNETAIFSYIEIYSKLQFNSISLKFRLSIFIAPKWGDMNDQTFLCRLCKQTPHLSVPLIEIELTVIHGIKSLVFFYAIFFFRLFIEISFCFYWVNNASFICIRFQNANLFDLYCFNSILISNFIDSATDIRSIRLLLSIEPLIIHQHMIIVYLHHKWFDQKI